MLKVNSDDCHCCCRDSIRLESQHVVVVSAGPELWVLQQSPHPKCLEYSPTYFWHIYLEQKTHTESIVELSWCSLLDFPFFYHINNTHFTFKSSFYAFILINNHQVQAALPVSLLACAQPLLSLSVFYRKVHHYDSTVIIERLSKSEMHAKGSCKGMHFHYHCSPWWMHKALPPVVLNAPEGQWHRWRISAQSRTSRGSTVVLFDTCLCTQLTLYPRKPFSTTPARFYVLK